MEYREAAKAPDADINPITEPGISRRVNFHKEM
jgi:hypothetical protein